LDSSSLQTLNSAADNELHIDSTQEAKHWSG